MEISRRVAGSSRVSARAADDARRTDGVVRNIAGMQQDVGQTSAGAGQVLVASGQLSGQAADLEQEIGRFIAEVKVA